MTTTNFPRGYLASGWSAGIKDDTLDFGVVHSLTAADAGAVFTRNNFPGNPIIVGRKHIARGRLQTVVVNSKNSNVATGERGLKLAFDTCGWIAENLGTKPELVLPSSTGVIGRWMNEEKIKVACCNSKKNLVSGDFPLFAKAIMTTDTHPKIEARELRTGIRITGVAKGAGMIEPNMATMLAYMFSDARMDAASLQRLIRAVVNRTFNRLSIDSDTSTSDTFAALCNGESGVRVHFPEWASVLYQKMDDPFSYESFELFRNSVAIKSITGMEADIVMDEGSLEFVKCFQEIARNLTKMIAKDGEGATKLIEINVMEARDREEALKFARSIVNSPLVKTAVYGADPNWGRIVMAVGKVFDTPVPYDQFQVYIGDLSLKDADANRLKECSEVLKQKEVRITVHLGLGKVSERVWGCDLTEEYVKVNAYYTT